VVAAPRSRTYSWDDPVAAAAAGRELPGIEYLRAVAEGRLPPPPIAATLDLRLLEIEEGRVVFGAEPNEFHYNPIGVVHASLAMTLVDSAIGCAVHSLLPAGAGYTSLETKVNFVRPLTRETGPVSCEGSIVYAGSRVATGEARLVDASGKLYAHGTSTCLILR
jgi:uncharacterized protein (TIGR00369 family)